MKKTRIYHLGNVLMLFSLLIFTYLFYPVIMLFLFPASEPIPQSQGVQLWIPKIHAASQVISNVNPWNKTEYESALKHGVALAKGFASPGEHGTIYLFAHSSGLPWELTRYNTVFLRLGELQVNDKIYLWKEGKKYTYSVINKKEVTPSAVKEVKNQKGDILIIQTCTPIGTDWNRLLLFAKRT